MVTVSQDKEGGEEISWPEWIEIEKENKKELMAAECSEEKEEAATLSLHSMVGLRSPKTLKVRGAVGELEVVVLIDSGATHNLFLMKW